MSDADTAPFHGLHGAPLHVRMRARSPHETHRAATPLELFFDLVFVVAIAQAGERAASCARRGHPVEGFIGYLMVFFAIWWAWMNFTWFASAYDCDDVPYRLAVFVQITGALILAAGVPDDVRDARAQPRHHRRLCRDAAGGRRTVAAGGGRGPTTPHHGISLCAGYHAPPGGLGRDAARSLALAAGIPRVLRTRASGPVWAERAEATTWHPHHIASAMAC